MKHLSRLAILSIALLGVILLPVWSQNTSEASPDEYRVYEAVFGLMDHIPKEDPHVTLFGLTLNSKCGEDGSSVPLVNGCTFLWIKPDTAITVAFLTDIISIHSWVDQRIPEHGVACTRIDGRMLRVRE